MIMLLLRDYTPSRYHANIMTIGLTVFTTILDNVYETSRQATDELKANLKIAFDEFLSKWNYTALAA